MPLRSERRFISYADIRSGMLVEFDYIPESGSGSKKYQVLVIDPNKQNLHTSDMCLHGLLTDDLGDFEVISLIAKISNLELDPEDRRSPITKLDTDAAYARYKGSVSKERRYRTFLRKNIKSVRQILTGELS